MPVDKKKNTPPDDKGATPNVVSADQLKPEHFHQYLPTNAIEGFFSNVRQRTDQIGTFTTEMSCLTIVWAVMQDIRFHKIAVS